MPPTREVIEIVHEIMLSGLSSTFTKTSAGRDTGIKFNTTATRLCLGSRSFVAAATTTDKSSPKSLDT